MLLVKTGMTLKKNHRECKGMQKAQLKRNTLNMYTSCGRTQGKGKGKTAREKSSRDKANLFVLATLSCTFLHFK